MKSSYQRGQFILVIEKFTPCYAVVVEKNPWLELADPEMAKKFREQADAPGSAIPLFFLGKVDNDKRYGFGLASAENISTACCCVGQLLSTLRQIRAFLAEPRTLRASFMTLRPFKFISRVDMSWRVMSSHPIIKE